MITVLLVDDHDVILRTLQFMVVCQEVCKSSGGLVSVAGTVIFLKLRLRMTA